MNETSSRSHSIFTITIEASSPGADGKDHIRVGKLNMVDLADMIFSNSNLDNDKTSILFYKEMSFV